MEKDTSYQYCHKILEQIGRKENVRLSASNTFGYSLVQILENDIEIYNHLSAMIANRVNCINFKNKVKNG